MLRTILATATLAALTGALAGCASTGMSEAECRNADWRAVGFEDGARGLGAEAIGRHRMACAEHDVTPHFDAYLSGHAQGVERYCDPRNGAELGGRGQAYTGVCPDHLEPAFVTAHGEAYGLYQRRSRVHAIGRRLAAKRQRYDQVEQLFVKKTAQLVGPSLTPSQRAAVVVELKQLGEERARLEDSIHELEHEQLEAQEEYDHYRGQLARRG